MILRDDHAATWTDAADSTLDRRMYYCQNWRADVVTLLAPNGRLLERAWYEPYGTPHGSSNGDFSGTSDDTNDLYLVPDGDLDADDQFVYLDLESLDDPLSDMTGNSDPGDPEYGRPNGVIDADDFFFFLDCAAEDDVLGRNQLSAGHDGLSPSSNCLRNRRGLAGYEWDPVINNYHVRYRVMAPETARWSSRDPSGYHEMALNLYGYTFASPLSMVDTYGLEVVDIRVSRPIVSLMSERYLPGKISTPDNGVRRGYMFRSVGDALTARIWAWRNTYDPADWVARLAALPPLNNAYGILSLHQSMTSGACFGSKSGENDLASYPFSPFEIYIIQTRNPAGLYIHGCNPNSEAAQRDAQILANKLGIPIYLSFTQDDYISIIETTDPEGPPPGQSVWLLSGPGWKVTPDPVPATPVPWHPFDGIPLLDRIFIPVSPEQYMDLQDQGMAPCLIYSTGGTGCIL